MSHYLPIMLDLRGKTVLLVGGGAVACEKLGRILEWTDAVTVIASALSAPTEALAADRSLTVHRRPFAMQDLDGIDIVIVAVDDLALQRSVYEEATRRKILCNAVDLAEYCHFIFPSIIRRDDLVVAISTSGASPAMAKHLKRFWERLIPDDIGDFLRRMRRKRTELPKGKERMALLDGMARKYVAAMAETLKKT